MSKRKNRWLDCFRRRRVAPVFAGATHYRARLLSNSDLLIFTSRDITRRKDRSSERAALKMSRVLPAGWE
jgi:hypothetical protein